MASAVPDSSLLTLTTLFIITGSIGGFIAAAGCSGPAKNSTIDLMKRLIIDRYRRHPNYRSCQGTASLPYRKPS